LKSKGIFKVEWGNGIVLSFVNVYSWKHLRS